MMTSLFSVFDPSSFFMISPWLVIFLFFLVFMKFWILNGGFMNFNSLLSNILMTEFYSIIRLNVRKGSLLVIYFSFFFIFFINFIALFPSVFTVSGHIMFSLSLSLLFWTSLIIFSFSLNMKMFISHLVPIGTPGVLMPFMVIVELVSNLIRPITLSVRLVANMVAGHLLMGLLGSFIISLPLMGVILMSAVGIILTFLEIAVSFIQGYVFLTLFSLYLEEVH